MNIKETIESLYTTNTNYSDPSQSTNQAESLKSLSNDLYTDANRFVYELLQNADDSAIDGEGVDVVIKVFNDTLVLAHTGKPFSPRDVKGLCSINNGTKKSDTTKTGFKGIGFKSVFGQSNKVTIFSNNEYFKFDANYSFGWKEKWKNEGNQKQWQIDNDRDFLYPWQIIPVYIGFGNDELESGVKDFLSGGDWNVATIIKVIKKEEIEKAIKGLSSNVNMFLFLKKINSIKFEIDTAITTIAIDRHENELVLKKDTQTVANWLINTITLFVPSELKSMLQADVNVPKKLKEADEIDLTLAIKNGDNGLEVLSKNESVLYAYLPTDEKRYSLPILVNTTFLTSANRESLHTDSKWNQWLFESISIKLFEWIAELVKGKYSEQAYNLIPKKLNCNDNLSNAYDLGIDKATQSVAFILSKEKTLLKVNEAIMDETFLSEKTFIGPELISEFIKNEVGKENEIVEFPFVAPNLKLKAIRVMCFSWSDIKALFDFDCFKNEHTVEKNIRLIDYLKNQSEITNSSVSIEKLKGWPFLYDHKNKLNYPHNIYFPTPDDLTWNNPENHLSFLHEGIQLSLINRQPTRTWLEKLGVIEKTDITFLEKTIIPNASTYVTSRNAFETIRTIFNLYKKENINGYLSQLSELRLLTTKGTLLSASECYFSDNYGPKTPLESVLDADVFLSDEYLVLDSDKDEVRLFLKKMGIQESIETITFDGKINSSTLIQDYNFDNEYFLSPDNHFQPQIRCFKANEYKNLINIKFISNLSNITFSKLFWEHMINDTSLSKFVKNAQAFWGDQGHQGRSIGSSVPNYPKWYVKNKPCMPTTEGRCRKSTDVFLNTNEIKTIAGKYLSVFDGVGLDQGWISFFQFKNQLVLDDYLELLTNIISDKSDDETIKKDNKDRIQLIFTALLELSGHWGSGEISKVKCWASSSYLTDENDNIISCNELKYYSDGNNSIFHNIHNFIALSEENKTHQNIEKFLGYFEIEVLRQSDFSIEMDGGKVESDLKCKLENIFPFLEKWIQKFNNELNRTILKEKFNSLQIDETNKLSLSSNGTILKSVRTHLVDDYLLVTTPWHANTSMLELPKVLCTYFDIKGYEDKLSFLLKADDELEIREYFENEEIELPINSILTASEDLIFKEEAISVLNATENDFNEIKKISDNYYHSSESSIEKMQYIQGLLQRSKRRVLEHLNSLDEYNCENVDNSALTVLSGILKNSEEIYIIPRPSDNQKVIIHYPSELDTLEYSESELWYENGASVPKKLTFGKILRDTKINQIAIIENEKEKVIDIINNPKNEEVACETILPSSLKIAQVMASLANTNGGHLIIGYSEENGIVGLNSDFNVTELTQDAKKYSSYFEEFIFKSIIINEKLLVTIKIEKSSEDILIDNKKYIRIGSRIKEEQEGNDKPLIITEGKTDWKHLKKALSRLQKGGHYTNLKVQFEEYEDMNMGDCELDRMVQTYSKTEQSKKHIFIFDRDNNNYVNKYAKKEFNNHKNNVYSFCIPKISEELDKICIEFYYKEEDLTTEGKNGKKIFIGKDFLSNGNSKCGKYATEKRNAKELDILDRDKKVYLRDDINWENNIALSKSDFTNNIINDVEGFNDFDIDSFKLIFDVVMKVVDD